MGILAVAGRRADQRRQRDYPQDVRHLVQCLARIAVVSLRRRLHAFGRLCPPEERAYPHRHRIIFMVEKDAGLD
ncbi:hypothetical protein D3C87_1933960 [compost metagenome]